MSRSALLRVVESFFRRWPVYLLLLVASVGFGYIRLQGSAAEFVSTGAIFVDNQSLVTTQSGVQAETSYGYLTPAQFTTQELNGLILTDVFMESVAATSDIELATVAADRTLELVGLRQALSTWPSSGNIVQISATTSDAEFSAQLAQAVLDEFIRFQIGIDVAESGASEEFFAELVESYRQDLAEARGEVDAMVRSIDPGEEMSAEQQLQLDRLRDSEAQANARYLEALTDLDVSRLAELQTETDIRQSYTILDIPEPPSAAGGRLFDKLVTLAMFALVGLILAIVTPVAAALLNQTVVFPDDLGPESPVQVIATLPKVKKAHLDLRRIPVDRVAGDEPDRSAWADAGERIADLVPQPSVAGSPQPVGPAQQSLGLAGPEPRSQG